MLKRLLFLLLFLLPMALIAQEYKVHYRDERIGNIFREWEKDWGYSIFFSPSEIDTLEKVSFQGRGTAEYLITEVLNRKFYDFTISGKEIVIKGYRRKVVISGVVKEIESEEDLPYATVMARSLGKGTASNGYGYFSIEIPSDSFTLEISCVGYRKKYISFSKRGNYSGNIYLEPFAELAQAVVTDSVDAQFVFGYQGSYRINQNILNQMTGMGNEKDLVRALQMLPGVQKGTDGSNGMIVRGGPVDQNLIMLDDAPIYNSSHLLGFFSVFSSDAVKSAELYKSGFSARYGGRLSSVLDVRTREGNRTKFGGHARLGTVASTLSFEGPIKKNSSSFYVTARRSNLDWIGPVVARSEEGGFTPKYYFYDINAKINIDLGTKRKMYLGLYHGGDYFSIKEQTETEYIKYGAGWNNLIGTFRLNRIYSDKIFGNLSITYSYYNFENDQVSVTELGLEKLNVSSIFRSTIEDWSVKYDLDLFTIPRNQIRVGGQAVYHRFLPDYSRTFINGSLFERNSVSRGCVEFAVYEENTFSITKQLVLEAGLRFSGVYSYDYFYVNPEPRVALKYQLNKSHQFSFNYDRMAQYVRLLNQGSMGIPVYMWRSVDEEIAPPVSDHASVSYDWKISESLRFRAEPYYKQVQRHSIYSPNFSIFSLIGAIPSSIINPRAIPFQLQSAGIDLMLEGKKGVVSYRLSYSWGRHQMRNPSVNNGKWFDSPQDKRHDIGVWLNARLGKKWNTGLTWVFSSGNPMTLPTSTYYVFTDPNIASGGGQYMYSFISSYYQLRHYPDIPNFRTPSYHRLDLFASYSFGTAKLKQELEFGLFNAYSRRNPFLYMLGSSDDVYKPVLTQVSVFPIIPSISYQVKW